MGILISEVGKLCLAIYNLKNYFSWTVAGKNISHLYSECVTEDGCEEKLLLAL